MIIPLLALIGNTYGSDGEKFSLPDVEGQIPIVGAGYFMCKDGNKQLGDRIANRKHK